MKILSTSWYFFQDNKDEWKVSKDGCRIMVSNICEYLGRKVDSYLFFGSKAVPNMDYGHIHVLDNRIYLPAGIRSNDNIKEWQVGLKERFRECLLEIKPDYVLIHDGGDFSRNCIEVCEKEGQPFSYVNHLFFGKKEKVGSEAEREWEEYVYSHIEWKTIAVGKGVKKRILETYPEIREKQICAIPNGTTYHGEEVENHLDDQYGLYGKKVLACVGSLQHRKNQMQLIPAFLQLPKMYREKIAILICGRDTKKEPIKDQLLNEIARNQLDQNIIYLGECDEEEMKKIYTRADGLIMPSISEGLSLVAMEMISYGKPVIMFADNETAYDIGDPNVVVLAKDHTEHSLSDAIQYWYDRNWVKAEIMHYASYFSMERVTAEYINYCANQIKRS